jgi:hypothetical protein
MLAQSSSSSRHEQPHDIPFPMLKEHLTNVIDELVSMSNKHKINVLIKKFDDEATKVHRLMHQAQEDIITVQTDCFNAIHDVLTDNDNSDVVDNNKNQDEQHDVEAQVVNDNVQQTSNASTEDSLLADLRADNGDVVDNNKNQDEQPDAKAQVVNNNVQQISKATIEAPYQLIYVQTMIRELKKPSLLYSPHGQMCRQSLRCLCHVVEPLLYLIFIYFANYSVLTY